MMEIVVGFLLTATAGSLGFTVTKLFNVASVVARLDERSQDHERRIETLEDVA